CLRRLWCNRRTFTESIHADDRIAIRRPCAWLERFHDYIRITRIGTHSGLAVDSDNRHAFRHTKVHFRRSDQSLFHEGLEYWCSQATTRIAATKRRWGVVTHEDANHEIGGETY